MKSMLDYFNKRYMPEPNSGCWLWTGFVNEDGYGIFCTGSYRAKTRRHIKAHRLAYEIFCGPIPDGKLVCHTCDTPSCVNPDHLFIGSWADNVADMVRKGRNKPGGKPHPGAKNGNSKLTEADVEAIRQLHKPGARKGPGSSATLAKQFGVDCSTVQRIVGGQTWRAQK